MSFTIYQASAGSGKTFSLAKEYLKIALVNPDAYKNILAITFTNKAAAEMKERIISYLLDIDSRDATSKGYLDILPIIVSETDLTQEKAMKNASIVLKNIMYNYADFSIMTIDAFFQRVLRTFAYDLDIPLNFQLEIDSKLLIEQVVELLIDQVGENEDLTKMMIDFVNSTSENSKSWHIEREILNFTPELFREQSKLFIDAFKDLSLNDFKKIIQSFVEEKRLLIKKTKTDVFAIQQLLLSVDVPEDAFLSKFMSKWLLGIANEDFAVSNILKKVLKERNWFSIPNTKKYESSFLPIESQIVDLLTQMIEDVQRILFINAIQKQIFPMALINELKGMLDQVESVEHTFQLSNTNFKLYEVTSQEPTPFIYERLGDKYFYYFIDEFQDTSRLQWLNMLPLICEAISAIHGVESGKAILFGDPKQAIYRFRGGDVKLFVSLPSVENPENNPLIDQMESALKFQFQSIQLDTNYRSYENVVTFNNDFFQYLIDKNPTLLPYYDNHQQKFLSSKQGGWVTIDERIKISEVIYSDFALLQIQKYIEDALKSGFSFRDIAILTRDKRHAPEIAFYLSNLGFPIISSESLLVTSSSKALFVLSLMRFNFQLTNQVLAFSLLTKFNQLFEFRDNFFAVSDFSANSIEEYFVSKGFQFVFKKLDSLSLYEKAEYIVRTFSLDAPAEIYVLTLLNLLNEKSSQFYHEDQFWSWWDENATKVSVEMPNSVDGITLLTVHKSKGLEYPIVIFPDYPTKKGLNDIWVNLSENNSDTDGKLKAAKMPVKEDADSEYSQDILDELQNVLIDRVNLLYVVLTRAVERLHVIIDAAPEAPKAFSYPSAFHGFVKDNIDANLEECEDYLHCSFSNSSQKRTKTTTHPSDDVELKKLNSIDWKLNQRFSAELRMSDAQNFGVNFHLVMSKIQSSLDVDAAIEFVEKSSEIDKESINKVRDMIHTVINHPLLNKYFSPECSVFNEMEVVDVAGDIHIPDRVVVNGEKLTIIDFKTGVFNQHHYEQVLQYKELYAQIGYTTINGFLVYVNESGLEIKMV